MKKVFYDNVSRETWKDTVIRIFYCKIRKGCFT